MDVLTILSQIDGVPERFRGIEKERWQRLLGRCTELGLLTPLGAGMYRIHPALPAYLAALWRLRGGAAFPKEQEAARLASVRAHAALGNWLFRQIQRGDAPTAMAVLAAECRTLGIAVAEALEKGLFEEARAIFQPLNQLWDARGLGEEARAWVDRCRELLEDQEGRPPDLETPGGALWLFMVISQANRSLGMGALEEAEDEYEAIRRVLERSSGKDAQGYLAGTYHQLGIVSQARGDLSGAESWYRKSLEIEESLGDRPGIASTYHELGLVSQAHGDLSGAEAWYRKSLEITESLGDRPNMASTYHQLGWVSQARGDLSGAESWYHKSLEITEPLGNRLGMAMTYHQLGLVSEARGDLSEAEMWYRKSLEIKESLGDRPGMARTFHGLGMVLQVRGELSGAESWYRKSLEITESLGDRPTMALTYAQLGLLTEARGNTTGALDWAVRCVALFPEFPNPLTGTGPRDLARLTARLGMGALEEAWQRCTGKPLPAAVRSWVEAQGKGPA